MSENSYFSKILLVIFLLILIIVIAIYLDYRRRKNNSGNQVVTTPTASPVIAPITPTSSVTTPSITVPSNSIPSTINSVPIIEGYPPEHRITDPNSDNLTMLRKLYEKYVVKKDESDTIVHFPCTFFFREDNTLGNKVELFNSTHFVENSIVNIAIHGRTTVDDVNLRFITDINLHERVKLQAILFTDMKRYYTTNIEHYYDSEEARIKSIISIHEQCEDPIFNLGVDEEFLILFSYKIVNPNMGACYDPCDNIHSSYLSTIESTYYCR